MMHHRLLVLVPALSLAGCEPKPESTPPTTTPEAEAPAPEPQGEIGASVANCSASYNVDAAIVEDGRDLDLQQLIEGTVITDATPFECVLPTSTSRAQFTFAASVTHSDCPYAMTYVNDGAGKPFSGTVTLDCSTSEIDYTATATPDSSDPKCAGASRLVDDPKIKLDTGNCGNDLD